MTQVLNSRDLSFILYELLDVDALSRRPRFADQGREVFTAVIDTAHAIADEHFSPSMRRNDQEEPQVVNGLVVTQPDLKATFAAVAAAGFIGATHDVERGGMQLPHVIASVAIGYFEAANVGSASYPMLTAGAANLIAAFGSPEQQAQWLPPMFDGRFSGTMALTEPDAGSSLSDIRTSAELALDGSYRITGTKIWISGGDQEITDNIVHLVLARIKGAPEGTKGISLFIVPKRLVARDGTVGERNHVTLAGLIHKMGWRGTTSTLLNFGEQGPCEGYLIGEPNKGLTYMFHMMNEARIGVGRAATAMGYAAYLYSLDYARTRRQGRLPAAKNPLAPPIPIIEHADVRRMLLQQKCAVEASLALVLQCARLVDDQQTAPDEQVRQRATLLLDVLTPIAKAWPSATCQDAISNAMQVLGGYGYAREYKIEQLYRDNRLNQIHEGTNAIQALDLLGRKVTQQQGASYAALVERIQAAVAEVAAGPLADMASALATAVNRMTAVTQRLVAEMQADPTRGLANASVYLDLVSRVVFAWIWLRQATVAARALDASPASSDAAFYHGKVQAARFYFAFELPRNGADADLLMRNDPSALDMQDEWF